MILLDTNILVRMCNHDDVDYQRTLRVVFALREREALAVSPQALYEFWAVATRALATNGLGMDGHRASRWISRFTRLFRFVHEPPTLFETWTALVAAHDVRGFRAHDARHAALARALGITQILTYNGKHYAQLPITVLDPVKL